MRMLLAREGSQIERSATISINAQGDTVRYHGHKGFNWRLLARLIDNVFVDRTSTLLPSSPDRPLAQQSGVVCLSKALKRGLGNRLG